MQTPPRGKSTASWAFDACVGAVGLGIAAWAVASFVLSGHLDPTWLLAALGGVPLIVLMSRFPLVLTRTTGGIEVGFESAVLVFLACVGGGVGALAVWAVGQAASQVSTHKRPDVRVFNVALSTLNGALALAVMRTLSDLDDRSPGELLAVGVGCAVYFATDYLVSGLSIALECGSSLREELDHQQGLLAGGVFVAIDSLATSARW